MRVLAVLEDALLAQRGHLIGWVPVCLGIGIGGYFSLRVEPDSNVYILFAVSCVALLGIARIMPDAIRPMIIGIMLIVCGAGLAKFRTEFVSAPVLGFRYYGAIEGRVVNIDRSASDAPRLTLDSVVLERMSPSRTPERIRVSIHGDQVLDHYRPGETLILTGHLSPPAGPAEPGGFDFQRHAWFLALGAVGYTRTPVLRLTMPENKGWRSRVFKARMAVSAAVQFAMPGETGAFAAAIMTGDRSGMGQETLAHLRASNLAHLLAISGLHMGLLTGFVFALVRYSLALTPGVALRWPTKKLAAAFAISTGAAYLALSGGNVATERAFIMVSVMFVAVLLDRRALTMRAVAMAAILVLLLRPEALAGPGFQMSFAATTALVAVFGFLRRFDLSMLPKWTQPVLSVVISSFVAGIATAPFAAAHFNQVAHYGLIANLLTVPLMGILVMPAAVLAACLAPFGLSSIGLALMEFGLRWILFVAGYVANLDGAVGHVIAPQSAVVPLLAAGLLWVVLWQGYMRWAGAFAVIVAMFMWQQSSRPALLVEGSGSLIGLLGADGRALSKPTGSSFVTQIWLENDGAVVSQEVAAERSGLTRAGRVIFAELGAWRILQASGKTALAERDGCDGADILISNMVDEKKRPCLFFDAVRLRETGALAIDLTENGDLQIITAKDVSGDRPWNRTNNARAESQPLVLSANKIEKGRKTGPNQNRSQSD